MDGCQVGDLGGFGLPEFACGLEAADLGFQVASGVEAFEAGVDVWQELSLGGVDFGAEGLEMLELEA